MMIISVIISVFVGLVVGCASMASWGVRRLGDKATRQFDRGFERRRWLTDLTTMRRLDPAGRTRRILIVPGDSPGGAAFGAHDHPSLLMPRRYRPAEREPTPDRRSDQARTWLEETTTRPDRIPHDSGSMARVCCKETANAR